MTNSRRKFLTGTATTGAAALALSAFPPSIRRALAIPANNATGTIKDVEHIVILMQENRSFDQYFGTLMGVRGFGDRFTIPLPKGLNVWQQSDANGKVILPYHLDSRKGNAQRVSGTPHSWSDGQNAWDGGRAYQWPRYKNNASMGYFKEAEVTFQFALANAFTLCDGYHCSMHTGTNSNRMFHWTGTNGPSGQVGTGVAGVASVVNEWDDIGPSTSGYEWKTYPERLQEAKVSWFIYQNMPDNFTDNPLAGFKQYRQANEASGKPVSNDTASPAYDPASDDAGNPLYKGIANTMPDGGFLEQFRQDIKNGKLPQVSWIIAPATYSEHPGPSSPVQGGWYIQQALDALTAVPEVWSKTVLLINFDENDGYFDHYPSPAAPSLNPDGTMAGKTTLPESDLAVERFTHPKPPGTSSQPAPDGRVYGPGVRVPMYVISPWSRGGWVNSQAFDHTSVLRFIEARFGVKETNISPFRRAVCGDLTSAFNFATPNSQALPTLAGRTTKDAADKLRADQQARVTGEQVRVGYPHIGEPRNRLQYAREEIHPDPRRARHRFALARIHDEPKRGAPLQRLRIEPRRRDLESLAFIRERRLMQCALDDLERFKIARLILALGHPKAVVLILLVAFAESDFDAPAAQDIERGQLFGHDQRMVERHRYDGRPQPDAAGLGGDMREQHKWPRRIGVVREVMLGQP